MDSDKLFVAAFDFGSTHSGYAFSARSSPNSIVTSKWEHNGLLFHKAPTSVLVNKKNEFVAFGFDAQDKYIMNMENNFWNSDDSDEETNDVNRYFNRFKMALHDETLNLKTMIKDQNGEEMKALDIFAFAIKYLNKQVIRKLNTWEGGRWNVETHNVHYVLTVPSTWDDQARVFMRKAAEQAGISGNQLTIALEHEAALTYCQVLRPYDQRDTNYSSIFHAIRRDKKYMVVDLGGGTFDITVHKRRSDGCLEEVVQPSRCYLGGTDIDIGIVRFLENLFGEQVMKELRLTELEDYNTLMYELEVKKQLIKSDAISDIAITMPFSLIEITKIHCGGIAAAINTSKYSDSISISGQKFLVNVQTFRDLFKPTINSLIKHIEQLFRHSEVSDIQQIIMVGGFAECELVQKAMEDRFPNIEIFLSEKAGLAVLKGAVMYGHQPQIRRHQNSAQVASVRTTRHQNSAQVASVRTTRYQNVDWEDEIRNTSEQRPEFPWYVQPACFFLLHLLGILYPLFIVYQGLYFVVVLCCGAEMYDVNQVNIQHLADFIVQLMKKIFTTKEDFWKRNFGLLNVLRIVFGLIVSIILFEFCRSYGLYPYFVTGTSIFLFGYLVYSTFFSIYIVLISLKELLMSEVKLSEQIKVKKQLMADWYKDDLILRVGTGVLIANILNNLQMILKVCFAIFLLVLFQCISFLSWIKENGFGFYLLYLINFLLGYRRNN